MKISITCGLFALSIAACNAVTLAAYNFNGEVGGTPDFLAPSTVAAGVTASNATPTGTFVRSTADLPGVTGGGSLASIFGNIGNEAPPASGSAAQAYVSFTIGAATAGQTLSLTSLSFLTNLASPQTSGAIYTLQYGSASSPSSFTNLTLSPDTVQLNSTVVTRTADLSGIDFSGFTSGVTFRINITEPTDTVNAPNSSARIDNFNLQGSVIPEPGSAVMLLGGAALGLIRRRRK